MLFSNCNPNKMFILRNSGDIILIVDPMEERGSSKIIKYCVPEVPIKT